MQHVTFLEVSVLPSLSYAFPSLNPLRKLSLKSSKFKYRFWLIQYFSDPFFVRVFQTSLQSATKLKKILQDSKESVVEGDIRSRMQPLKDQLTNTISHLHMIFETHVFIAICRGYWDRMGQVRLLCKDNTWVISYSSNMLLTHVFATYVTHILVQLYT